MLPVDLPPDNYVSLQYMQELSRPAQVQEEIVGGKIRTDAMRLAGLSYGTQGGLSYTMAVLHQRLEANESKLNNIFDFSKLMLDNGRVTPPVLLEARDAATKADNSTAITYADRVFRIKSQAKMALAPVTWKEYLLNDHFSSPEEPDPVLLPQNSEERRAWRDWVAEGWNAGVEQAYDIMDANIYEMQEDFLGMVRYRIMLQHDMVSEPFVAKSAERVIGGGDTMTVGQQVLRITALPVLNADDSMWKSFPQLPTPYSMDWDGEYSYGHKSGDR